MIFYNKELDITKCEMNKDECLKAAFFCLLYLLTFNTTVVRSSNFRS